MMLIDEAKVVEEARTLAQERHAGQMRDDGSPYFNHVERWQIALLVLCIKSLLIAMI